MFQHTAARRRLVCFVCRCLTVECFNTQPPEGGWPILPPLVIYRPCFNTQPPEGGWTLYLADFLFHLVSTHSRPKAAGLIHVSYYILIRRFNTQPPEGGWLLEFHFDHLERCFNTQPPEGGWMFRWLRSSNAALFQHTAARRRLVIYRHSAPIGLKVSTHSRPKAAGCLTVEGIIGGIAVSTHSRPKAAGLYYNRFILACQVSTHSRPKAAGTCRRGTTTRSHVSTHSRPKAAGRRAEAIREAVKFQHTAARRRLVTGDTLVAVADGSFNTQPPEGGWCGILARRGLYDVSTHSRPKAAGIYMPRVPNCRKRFQHTAARRRLADPMAVDLTLGMFQHTAARRRLGATDGAYCQGAFVSTHSRPKAAGCARWGDLSCSVCFNTQPPEGGWSHACIGLSGRKSFNTQPPEGGWAA